MIDAKKKCESVQCEKPALAKVYWPGRDPLKMCLECAAKAQRVGDAIGCQITVEEYHPEIGGAS